MSEGWEPTQDWSALLRLHRKWNPGLYELADQYSHLRPSDLISKGFRGWVYRQNAQSLGYALARIGTSVPVTANPPSPCETPLYPSCEFLTRRRGRRLGGTIVRSRRSLCPRRGGEVTYTRPGRGRS